MKSWKKKKKEVEVVKEELKKFQEMHDEVKSNANLEIQEHVNANKKNEQAVKVCNDEIEYLKKENQNLLQKIADLEIKISAESHSKPHSDTNALLCKAIKDLETKNTEKLVEISGLTEKVRKLEVDIITYKQMYEHAVTSQSEPAVAMSPHMPENVSNILQADLQATQAKLEEKSAECTHLKKKFLEETEKSKRFEKITKMSEKELQAKSQNIRSLQIKVANLQTDKNKLQEQLSLYEAHAKRVPQTSAELSPIPKPSSTSDVDCVAAANTDFKVGKLWENVSSTPRLKDAKASALCCTEQEFSRMKKTAQTLTKHLQKKFDSSANQLTYLVQQSQNFGSVKDFLPLLDGLLEFFKLQDGALEVTAAPKRRGRPPKTDDLDSNPATLLAANKSLEEQVAALKQQIGYVKSKMALEVELKMNKIKLEEEKYEKLKKSKQETEVKSEKLLNELNLAKAKNEDYKKLLETMNRENKRLVEWCERLNNKVAKAQSKMEPCNKCDNLTKIMKQNKLDHDKKKEEYKMYIMRLENQVQNLEQLIEEEKSKRMQLEFDRNQEMVFNSGSVADRNAFVHHYFEKGLAELRESQRKSEKIEQPKQIVSFNTCIVHPEKKNAGIETLMATKDHNVSSFANKSLRGGFLQTDDEEDFLNYSSLAQIRKDPFFDLDCDPDQRLQELQRRNTLCLPHLQSSYPLEIQDMTPSENKYFDPKRSSLHPRCSYAPEVPSVSKKRKIDEESSFFDESIARRGRRSSFLASYTHRFKPLTPVRKTGTLSKTFKTPSSIRRLKKRKDKFQ